MRISDWSSDVCSSDLGEIAKLALYLDASPEHPKSVEPPVVAALVSGHSESDLGALVNAVLGGQPGEAERQIANAALDGIAGIPLNRGGLRRLQLLAELSAEVASGQSVDSAIAAKGQSVYWKDVTAPSGPLARWQGPARHPAHKNT